MVLAGWWYYIYNIIDWLDCRLDCRLLDMPIGRLLFHGGHTDRGRGRDRDRDRGTVFTSHAGRQAHGPAGTRISGSTLMMGA